MASVVTADPFIFSAVCIGRVPTSENKFNRSITHCKESRQVAKPAPECIFGRDEQAAATAKPVKNMPKSIITPAVDVTQDCPVVSVTIGSL